MKAANPIDGQKDADKNAKNRMQNGCKYLSNLRYYCTCNPNGVSIEDRTKHQWYQHDANLHQIIVRMSAQAHKKVVKLG